MFRPTWLQKAQEIINHLQTRVHEVLEDFSKDEFIKNMTKLESLDLFDDKTLCLGFSDGISLKNVFSNEPATEMRIFEELNQSLEIKNREIVLRVKEEGYRILEKE